MTPYEAQQKLCALCGALAVMYCKKCDKWFCERCKDDWPRRVVAAATELAIKAWEKVFGGG